MVIFQHGITGNKSNAAGIAGSLAAAGFATVAIDHPLHGDRGFDLNNDGTDEINASDNVTAYMNLSNLLAARDNVRQSIADLMGLRVSLNYFQASDGAQINGQKVFFVGHSLGAIAGVGFTGITNTPFPEQSPLSALNGQFAVQATSLAMPGGSVANFLLACLLLVACMFVAYWIASFCLAISSFSWCRFATPSDHVLYMIELEIYPD